MQINGKTYELRDIVDAGVRTWEELIEFLGRNGIDYELGSSVLAVAVAGAMTNEGITAQQFLSIVQGTLPLWRLEQREAGPVLVFDRSLLQDVPVIAGPGWPLSLEN